MPPFSGVCSGSVLFHFVAYLQVEQLYSGQAERPAAHLLSTPSPDLSSPREDAAPRAARCAGFSITSRPPEHPPVFPLTCLGSSCSAVKLDKQEVKRKIITEAADLRHEGDALGEKRLLLLFSPSSPKDGSIRNKLVQDAAHTYGRPAHPQKEDLVTPLEDDGLQEG